MSNRPGTLSQSVDGKAAEGARELLPLPGVALVFSMGRPLCVALPLSRGSLELGRAEEDSTLPVDPKMSRRHATVAFDGERFRISDAGSHNGTYLDGVRLRQGTTTTTTSARVLRLGDSIYLLSADLRPLKELGVKSSDELIIGPGLHAVFAQAARAAQFGRTLHITGESGSGKEGVARAFHETSSLSSGPFVALSCATIASGVAERLLFGARRGAFSGAVTDSEGLIQAADGGTLFLDEIGELDAAVQAKLLRVLETRDVLAMGALRTRRVNMQLCSASHRDLRAEISAGRFREDLYFRLSKPEAVVPPLRQRLEEIPWLVERAVKSVSPELSAHSSLIETCLLRHWPGNVRELLAELRAAAQDALGRSGRRVEAQHLDNRAGALIAKPAEPQIACPLAWPANKSPGSPERAQIEEALKQTGGNISATARSLGLHRTQLKRLIERYGSRTFFAAVGERCCRSCWAGRSAGCRSV
jgi:transcriptional regulator with GAF, ATPase, and Fis domain